MAAAKCAAVRLRLIDSDQFQFHPDTTKPGHNVCDLQLPRQKSSGFFKLSVRRGSFGNIYVSVATVTTWSRLLHMCWRNSGEGYSIAAHVKASSHSDTER